MRVEDLSPPNRRLLIEALPEGQLLNVLYQDGERLDAGVSRERRCFALGERGWLNFVGWEGSPVGGDQRAARWALTNEAQTLLRALAA
jgi:hypothetical protein